MADLTLAFTAAVGAPDAPHLVLGHSLGTSAALWAEAVPLLANSFRVTCVDLPGHGDSPAATGSYLVGDVADAIVAHLDDCGVSNFRYAGVSIGGAIGLDLARRHPARVFAAVVVSAGARVDSREMWAERAASVRIDGTASLVPGTLQRWFAPGTTERHPDRTERMMRALRETDDESYALACEALADFDIADRLGEVEPPILALWGEYDQLVPEARSVDVAKGVRRGIVDRVPDAAHAAPLEQPGTVAGQLADFFGSLESVEPIA